jgi:hypothetical protein
MRDARRFLIIRVLEDEDSGIATGERVEAS